MFSHRGFARALRTIETNEFDLRLHELCMSVLC